MYSGNRLMRYFRRFSFFVKGMIFAELQAEILV